MDTLIENLWHIPSCSVCSVGEAVSPEAEINIIYEHSVTQYVSKMIRNKMFANKQIVGISYNATYSSLTF